VGGGVVAGRERAPAEKAGDSAHKKENERHILEGVANVEGDSVLDSSPTPRLLCERRVACTDTASRKSVP
jgi:hypothetical protein